MAVIGQTVGRIPVRDSVEPTPGTSAGKRIMPVCAQRRNLAHGHRYSLEPVMRWIVDGHAVTKQAASSSQMGCFETEVLSTEENLAALADLSGQ